MFVSFSHHLSIHIFFYFLIYMVIVVHLGWKKVSVYWSMSLVDSLLGGKENPIITVASCLLGCHVSQRLWTCWGMENWLKHLCSLEHFPSLSSISLRRFGVIGFFLCVYLDFTADSSTGDQDGVDFSLSSALHWFSLLIAVNFDGDSCTYQLT